MTFPISAYEPPPLPSQKQHEVIGDSPGVCALSASHGGYSGLMGEQAVVFVLQRTNRDKDERDAQMEMPSNKTWMCLRLYENIS